MPPSASTSECRDFLRGLIQTEALPGQEGDLAKLVADELERLGFVDVHFDEVGNVLGRVRGTGSAPGLVFNTHLDHVDVGDHAKWPHPPYGGVIDGNDLCGRGAVDIKGPLAAQVYGAAELVLQPAAADVWVTAVVQEEVGGVGARHLTPRLSELCGGNDQPLVVVGEPSSNQVRRGHRGRVELRASFYGRSAHASAPERAINPLYAHARFLQRIETFELHNHRELGASSLAPTLLSIDQTSANVIPAEVHQTLDVRTVPGQDLSELREQLAATANRAVADQQRCEQISVNRPSDAVRAEVSIPIYPRETYTGLSRPIPADNPTYLLGADHPAVLATVEVVARMGGRPGSAAWTFATDGGHFAEGGAIPVGFGPGDEALAHTVDERIDLDQLDQAVAINEQLARELPSAVAG